MADNDRGAAWIGVFGAIVVALIGAGVTIWSQRSQSPPPSPIPSIEEKNNPSPLPASAADGGSHQDAVMGQLEPGINRQGMDFDGYGRSAPNAELCAELCRAEASCKAMTYVISLKTCWMKKGVPDPYPPGGEDYVSAVKVP